MMLRTPVSVAAVLLGALCCYTTASGPGYHRKIHVLAVNKLENFCKLNVRICDEIRKYTASMAKDETDENLYNSDYDEVIENVDREFVENSSEDPRLSTYQALFNRWKNNGKALRFPWMKQTKGDATSMSQRIPAFYQYLLKKYQKQSGSQDQLKQRKGGRSTTNDATTMNQRIPGLYQYWLKKYKMQSAGDDKPRIPGKGLRWERSMTNSDPSSSLARRLPTLYEYWLRKHPNLPRDYPRRLIEWKLSQNNKENDAPSENMMQTVQIKARIPRLGLRWER